VIKLISFIVLTQFFHFNKLNFFLKLNQQYFFTVTQTIMNDDMTNQNTEFKYIIPPICFRFIIKHLF